MLDQLIESKDTSKEGSFRNMLLMGTMFIVASAFIVGLYASLMAQNFFVGGDGLELSTLVAPPIPEEAPPPPEPEQDQPKKQAQDDNSPKISTRTEAIARLDMSPKVPDRTSVEKFKGATVPDAPFKISDRNEDAAPNAGPARSGGNTNFGKPVEQAKQVEPEEAPERKPPPPPPPPPPPKVPQRISGGVVNGSAISLPTPPYPAAARAANAKGAVNVAVVISKTGSVISANAVSGHPLLRQAAASAARSARFRPTLLSGQPVEVSGVIVYNFQ